MGSTEASACREREAYAEMKWAGGAFYRINCVIFHQSKQRPVLHLSEAGHWPKCIKKCSNSFQPHIPTQLLGKNLLLVQSTFAFLVLRLRPGHVWFTRPGRLAQLAECTCHQWVPAGPGCALSRSRLRTSLQACSLPVPQALSTILSVLPALLANLRQPFLWLHC